MCWQATSGDIWDCTHCTHVPGFLFAVAPLASASTWRSVPAVHFQGIALSKKHQTENWGRVIEGLDASGAP